MRKRESGFRPVLDDEGQVERFILSLMDGQTTLDEIARRAFGEFPGRFASPAAALTRAGDLSAKHSR